MRFVSDLVKLRVQIADGDRGKHEIAELLLLAVFDDYMKLGKVDDENDGAVARVGQTKEEQEEPGDLEHAILGPHYVRNTVA